MDKEYQFGQFGVCGMAPGAEASLGACLRAWPAHLAAAGEGRRTRNLVVGLEAGGRQWAFKATPLDSPWSRWRAGRGGGPGRRAFVAAQGVVARGIATPPPVAWADLVADDGRRWSVYVCAWLPAAIEARALQDADADPGAARELGSWLARMHEVGIDHHDLTAGNCLLAGGGWHLIDLDRVRFATVEPGRGLARLAMLELSGEVGDALVASYAAVRGLGLGWARRRYRAWMVWHRARFVVKNRTRSLRRALDPWARR